MDISQEFRPHRSTMPDRDRASWMERAARGRMQSARHLAMKNDAFAFEAWRGQWNGGKKRAGIGMPRICKQRFAWPDFDNAAEMHHRDAIGDMLHHGEVVGNENVGQAKPVLQIAQQVEHLRADRDIERGYRLVANDKLRLDRKSARDGDALALAAGKLVRIAAGRQRFEPDQAQQFVDALAAP